MTDSAMSVFVSRLDFAWITSLHIIYPPLTIGRHRFDQFPKLTGWH